MFILIIDYDNHLEDNDRENIYRIDCHDQREEWKIIREEIRQKDVDKENVYFFHKYDNPEIGNIEGEICHTKHIFPKHT